LNRGPVSVAVDASTWNNYMGGIIQYHCETRINHAVQIVGYDISGTTIIRLSYYVSLHSEFHVVMSVTKFRIKSMFGSFYNQLFVGELMSCLRYLCLFAHSSVQHTLCYVLVLCTICCQFLWIVRFWLPRQCSVTFI
jgi:hypothetical protein